MTIWMTAGFLLMGLALVAAVLIGAAARANARAGTAADLAALAAAAAAVRNDGDPCTAARRIADANGAGLARCLVEGVDVRVWTQIDVRVVAGWAPVAAQGRARAGPVSRPLVGGAEEQP